MERNAHGSFVGEVQPGYERSAARTYRIQSSTTKGTSYFGFVERLHPPVVRCSCPAFVVDGACKHGTMMVQIERGIARRDPEQYRRERGRIRELLAARLDRAKERREAHD